MTAINKKLNASYNMLAPEISDDSDKKTETIFPTSETANPTVSANAASVKVRREKTVIKLGTLTAACTLNLAVEKENLNIGAVVAVNWKSDATARNVTVKSGAATLATLAGTASAESTRLLIWDGSVLLPVS